LYRVEKLFGLTISLKEWYFGKGCIVWNPIE